eukprot:jgi/Astpho2/6865/Aster-06537
MATGRQQATVPCNFEDAERLISFQEAEGLIRRSLAIREQAFGPDDVQGKESGQRPFGHSRQHAGPGQLGQLPEAEQLCRQCLEIREAQLGPQHAETAAALMGVGSVLLEQQQRAEAKLLLEKAVYLSILKLGEPHSQTRQARELLGRC